MHKSFLRSVAVLAGVMLFPGMAPAQEIVVRQGQPFRNAGPYQGTQDTSIFSFRDLADTNLGAAISTIAGETTSRNERRILLRFDGLESLTDVASQITAARLRLTTVETGRQTEPFAYAVYAIKPENAGWKQGDKKKPAQAGLGEATWNNKAFPDQPWAGKPGLDAAGVDYDAKPLAELTFSCGDLTKVGDTNGTPVEVELPLELVKQWIAGQNAGVLIKVTQKTNGLMSFNSSESKPAENRPALILTQGTKP